MTVVTVSGVVVAALPWALPGSRFTTAFEDTAAWLVCHATLSVVAVVLRIASRVVSGIVTRVVASRVVPASGSLTAGGAAPDRGMRSHHVGNATCWWSPTTTVSNWAPALTHLSAGRSGSTPWSDTGPLPNVDASAPHFPDDHENQPTETSGEPLSRSAASRL
ncbi:MAG: hypothetical protein M3332_12235 [Actinomycetota bacterium]|nr:hypothetical protein [Actinomycetota bacterium]